MINLSLLTFLLNSLWQIPLAAAVAALACRLMRNGPARHRHAVWVAALALAILLPLASVRHPDSPAGPQFDPSLIMGAARADSATRSLPVSPAQAPAAASAARNISLNGTTAVFLVGVYALFLLFQLLRLAWAVLRTVQIRRAAQARTIPERLEAVLRRSEQVFGLTGVEILFSPRVSGPVTAGRTIILPETLLAEHSEDVLVTAIGHEMAHVARRDFAWNVLFELLYAPVSFQPAAWLIRRRIEHTREMACDELVTERLIDAGIYARSIMSIAASMTALPRPGYTLGVFDGNVLEERIRRLMERPAANLKRARLLLVTGLAALALCALVASTLALTARAQGAASGVLAQGEAAYNRADYTEAASQFAYAVQLEPANLKARLYLANALLRQYAPATEGPDSPLSTAARQQYLEVLARDPANTQALNGMAFLCSYTGALTDAHDWALKSIQANATDKLSYYIAGFVDWSIAYVDYIKARRSSGMRDADPGIIPDAALRVEVRAKHLARVEEGERMLRTALQLDPGHVDSMAYLNLLYRIKAGIADSMAESDAHVAEADRFVREALEMKKKALMTARFAPPKLDLEGNAQGVVILPPPPPPPPPPPRGQPR